VVADFIYIIIYYVVRYRVKVVRRNLAESFPEMSADERSAIERRFFRNFADYIVETIKLLHISDRQIMQRMTFEGVDQIDRLFDEGHSIVAYFSHCGNWEWAPSVTLHTRHRSENGKCRFCQVYRPLRNRWMDRMMLRLRSRFGSVSYPKRTVFRDLFRLSRDGILTITGFMSDQKPSHGDDIHVVRFLNHPTAIITGTEQLGRKLKMAAVYWDVYKLRRGHYKIVTRVMTDDIAQTPHMYVTDQYASMLEETIRRDPAIWLWTHKRWKNPVEMPEQSNHE
ncbi:MAG: lysophospholipid acyltransferase family protein, partial [Muribaculaceae bacterium]|nr:lysophospholipid acyltransferase family protein [Muribaculaceae bacterium]